MAFESVNELDKFIYDDCQVMQIKQEGSELSFMLEALIVGARNSQNSNYTDSYADETKMILSGVVIESMIIEGYNVYDADDNLQKSVEDEVVPSDKIVDILTNLGEAYLFSVEYLEKSENGPFKCRMEIDTGELDRAGLTDPYTATYEIVVKFDKALVTWERYMNKVQN